MIPNSFPAKITLTQVRMQTLAHFVLCRAQIGPCWPILPLSGRLARFPLPLATRCMHAMNISHKRTGLYFEFANDDIHLPKNPLGLIVNGLCFSPDNVFSITCIHPFEETLSGEKYERWTMQHSGTLGR